MQDLSASFSDQLENAKSFSIKGDHKKAELRMLLMLDAQAPQNNVLLALGDLYEKRFQRFDLALACYARVEKDDPSARKAEIAIARIYQTYGMRSAPEQWQTLMGRKDRIAGNTQQNTLDMQ